MRSKTEHLLMTTCLMIASFLYDADALQRNCLFFKGKCVDRCPPNMHPYHTRCDVETLSQRTCAFPNVYELGFTCGWSRCDCDSNLVLSDHEGCIPLTDCVTGTFHAVTKDRRKRRRGKKYQLHSDSDVEEMHKGLEPVHYMGDLPAQDDLEPRIDDGRQTSITGQRT